MCAPFVLWSDTRPWAVLRHFSPRAAWTMPPARLSCLAAGLAARAPIVASRRRVRADGPTPVVASRISFAPRRRRLLVLPAASPSRDDDAPNDDALGGSPDPAADDADASPYPHDDDDDEWHPARVFAAAIQTPILWMPAADAPRPSESRPPGGDPHAAASSPSPSVSPRGSLRGSAYAAMTLHLLDLAPRFRRDGDLDAGLDPSRVAPRFIVDSARATNVIVPDVARDLDLDVGQSPDGATGAPSEIPRPLGACAVGDDPDDRVVLRGLSAAVGPVPAPNVAGVLGRQFMDCFDAVAFDWRGGAGDPNAAVTFYQRYDFENAKRPETGDAGFDATDVVTATPVEFARGSLACEVSLRGARVPALIDTGAPRTILNAAAARIAGAVASERPKGAPPRGESDAHDAHDAHDAPPDSDSGSSRVSVRWTLAALPDACAVEVLGEGDDGRSAGARVSVGEVWVGESPAFRAGLGLGDGEPGVVLGLDALTSRGRVVLRTTPGRLKMRL